MHKTYALVALIGFALLSACTNTPAPKTQPMPNNDTLGVLTVHISGVGSDITSSHTEFSPTLSAQGATQDESFDSSSFTLKNVDTFVTGGRRYINALYGLTNSAATTREVTMVAVDTDGDGSALSNVKVYDGSAADGSVNLELGAAKDYNYVDETVVPHPLNGYVSVDPTQLTLTANPAPTVLSYGFRALKSDVTSSFIGANDPAKVLFSSSFDSSIASAQHPFSFDMTFIVVAEDIAVNSVTGELTSDDTANPDVAWTSYYIDYYELIGLTVGDTVVIELSGNLRPEILLYDKDIRVTNGGSGGKIESTTSRQFSFVVQDNTNYLLGVSSLFSRDTGTYTLTSYNADGLTPFTFPAQ